MKNALCFILKTLFVLEIVTCLFWHFGYVDKQPDNKAEVIFKIYDATDWKTINYNIHIDK